MPTINNVTVKLSLIILMLMSTLAFSAEENKDANFADFYNAINIQDEKAALHAGLKTFQSIEKKYRSDAGFTALKSKLAAAEFLAGQMTSQLKKATDNQFSSVAEDLFTNPDTKKNAKKNAIAVAPAKRFYETSMNVFSKPAMIDKLETAEKQFIAKYYNLKLLTLTSAIAKAGQALAIAEPTFQGTYNYVLVLPLLHTSTEDTVNIDVLPKWTRQPEQLRVFSDSALLHFGLPYQAQGFALGAAQMEQKDFSACDFYKEAARKSAAILPGTAVECLGLAINLLPKEQTDAIIDINLQIVQVWLDSDNFDLAAGHSKKISQQYPDSAKYSNAVWLYYYALSRANNATTILNDIDSAIEDSRCSEYKSKLMYTKWWALRRQRQGTVSLMAIEHQLLNEFSDDVMIAPIMLSRATDLLAGQDYTNAIILLNQIQKKFPATIASQQAKKMMEKLEAIQNTGQVSK